MRLGCIDCSIRSPHLSFVWISPIAGILIDVNYPDSFLVFRTITTKHYLPSLNRLSSPLSDQTMGYFSHAHDHCSLFVAGELGTSTVSAVRFTEQFYGFGSV